MNDFFRLTIILAAFFSMSQPSILQSQNALDFDGINDFVQTTYGGVLGSANRSFEAWIKINAGITTNKAITDYGLNAVGSRNTFVVGSNYQLGFISGGTNANIFSSTNVVPANMWTHVAFVLNNGTGYLYVNGNQVGTGSLTTVNTPGGNANMTIGQRVAGGSIPFPGEIDEVRIWNYARTQTEIQNAMNSELCTMPAGLMAYYQFNEGMAGGTNTGISTLPDLSGNTYNGTLNNFALTGNSSNWVSGAPIASGEVSIMLTESACGSYTSPSGNYTWTSSGTYADTVQSALGCDSLFSIDLTIGQSSADTITPVACNSYTSPSGNYIWTISNTYADTIPNALGCDSILTIHLTINNSTADSLSISACDNYTAPSGQIYFQSGTYTDIIPNSNGCDSVITINLSIIASSSQLLVIQECDSFTSPSGNYTWFSTGNYADTITNANGCDSILLIDLTLGQSSINTIDTISCDPYTSPSGNYTWTESGTYQDTITNNTGCPEFITIHLTTTITDTSVSQLSNFSLLANATGLEYQWLDCDDNFNPIFLAIDQQFDAAAAGTYAVQITNGNCVDTSSCHTLFSGMGIVQSSFGTGLSLYPNPAREVVFVELGATFSEVAVELFDLSGRLVFGQVYQQTGLLEVGLSSLPEGSYVVRIVAGEMEALGRVVIW